MAYKIKQLEAPEESNLAMVARDVARTGARVAETVAGLPGDILKFGHSVGVLPDLPKGVEFPGSQLIRENVTQKLTGKYLEPTGSGEELSDQIFSDLAAFAIPVGGKIPFKAAITRAIGGNVASLMAKNLGAGETGQAATKLGFNILMGVPGTRKSIIKNQEALKESMTDSIRPMEKYRTTKLDPIIGKAKKIAKYGEEHNVPWKKSILSEVEKLENSMSGPNYLNIEKSVALEQAITDKLRAGDFPKESVKTIESLRDGIKSALHDFGKTENQEFYKHYKPWSSIDNGLNASSKVGKFIQDNSGFNIGKANPLTRSAFGLATSVGKKAVIAPVAGGYNLLSLLGKSKDARSAYENVIKSSLAGNARVAATNLKKFDAEASRLNPEGKYKIKSLG